MGTANPERVKSHKGSGAGASIVWFRNDLRLADNPALHAAANRGGPVVPVFVWAPEEEGEWRPGAASRWWLHQSLKELTASLGKLGAGLVLRRGNSLNVLKDLADEVQAEAVFWNAHYEPAVVERDATVAQELRASGLQVETFDHSLLIDPRSVRNSSGKPFQVFTAFWRHCLGSMNPPLPLTAPRKLSRCEARLRSVTLASLELEPRINWTSGLTASWHPGEAGAQKALNTFCAKDLGQYRADRDRPDLEGTSRLSPHLHFGEITARQIWHRLQRQSATSKTHQGSWKNSQFVAELGWREFAHHLLCHFPQTPDQPLRAEFEDFPWQMNPVLLKAWQKGRTGYPMVDAGMRQLWTTGWMHNRVRMIVASFLVKDLLIQWQQGARWFWDTLVDADLANNTLGWQWTAGCGADAAPFFRVFNPINQGEKFDPEGHYVRRWVPELANMPAQWIHQPWRAPAEVLHRAGVVLGKTYPLPIVDHTDARSRALAAFEKLKRKNATGATA